ncbi:MAG: NAD(P)-binding domain-containing protein [Hyphomicrobium sp.]|uniref:NADPH-dependent F420 reductase n=1 Tax=Hyphomicrobium sp. TaxID=82 RepID=UPI0025BEF5A4|nr:NAD(P)-binding domain-containing protein [Hyphomicrobium sp.]MBX9864382.1 NAD(P)-binding domain-containing protein [Hyphomicrobium sp.]
MSARMSIGILGAGKIGRAFAHALFSAGIRAKIANSRDPLSLTSALGELQPLITPVDRDEAASADIVLVAVPWSKLPTAFAGLPAWKNRIVIDANNPVETPLIHSVHPLFSSEVVAQLAPDARIVKAFNYLQPHQMVAHTQLDGHKRVQFYAGDDKHAKADVAALIDELGFLGVDLGSLREGSRLIQYPGGVLAGLDLIKADHIRRPKLHNVLR